MGINNELNVHGCNINIQFANEENPQQLDYISGITPTLVGILVLSVYSDKFLWPFLDLGVPMVFLDTGITDVDRAFLRGDVVLNEGLYSVESLTRHLIAQGIKNIGFIGDITYCRSIRDRYEGFLLGLKSTDIEPDESVIAVKHMPERYYLRHEVEEALSCFKYIPEAIVCANDDIAMHVIGALRAREFRVPDDVAVTGYDDLESLIEHITPFISTVKIHHAELGRRLARQLMWRIENPDASKEIIVIRGEVIIRGSSARQAKNKTKGD
jgi:LacI family transcriptional regulator